jgi:molybdate transport system permease protein
MLAGNIPGKTATIPVAIYFEIQAGHMNHAIILVMITLVIAFSSLVALAYWNRRKPKPEVIPLEQTASQKRRSGG